MPLYEYKCSKCHSVFEVIQKVNEPPLEKCLKCGASVQKIISAPAIQFKGSGWYITDYARQNAPTSEKKELKTSKASTEKKEDKKSSPATSTK